MKILFQWTFTIILLIATLSLHAQCPSDTSIIACYSFSGNALDETGNGNDGTVLGPVLTNDSAAYYFDGVDDWINLGDGADFRFQAGKSFSLVARVYVEKPTNYGNILRYDDHDNTDGDVPTTRDLVLFRINDQGIGFKFHFLFGPGPGSSGLLTSLVSSEYAYNQWYWVTGVYDAIADSAYLYVGSCLEDEKISNSGNNWITTGQYLMVGRHHVTEFFKGKIDQITIYNKAIVPAYPGGKCEAQQSPGAGLALDFDGQNDRLDLPTQIFNPQKGTISYWFQMTEDDMTRVPIHLYASNGNSTIYNGWSAGDILEIHTGTSNGKVRFLYQNGLQGNNLNLVSASSLVPGKWYHVAVTYHQSDSAFMYLNGVQVAVKSMQNKTFKNYPVSYVRFGAPANVSDPNLPRNFKGQLDELQTWDTVLTQQQIREYMCRTIPAFHPEISHLTGYYHLDDQNLFASDASGNSFHATLRHIDQCDAWPLSGAAVGDTSVYLYPSIWQGQQLQLDLGNRGLARVDSFSGSAGGVQMYWVNKPFYNTAAVQAPDSCPRVVGIFPSTPDSLQYQLHFAYGNVPQASGPLKLGYRIHQGHPCWFEYGQNQDASTSVVTHDIFSRRGEFFLADMIRGGICEDFEKGTGGFRNEGDAFEEHTMSAGWPSGGVAIDDLVQGRRCYLNASYRFLGDWSMATASDSVFAHIHFDSINYSNKHNYAIFYIEGPGGKAKSNLAFSGKVRCWEQYASALDSNDWVITDGNWQAILTDVQRLYIASEFTNAYEIVSVDNVALTFQPEPNPILTQACSSFADDEDGWQFFNFRGIQWINDPAKGRVVELDDASSSNGLGMEGYAPAKFEGDWRPLDGVGKISYDVKVTPYAGTTVSADPRLKISGPGGRARITANQVNISNQWDLIEFPIDSCSWTMELGTWSELIKDVTQIWVRLEFVNGLEYVYLGNFCITGCLPPPITIQPIDLLCHHDSMGQIQVAFDSSFCSNRHYDVQWNTGDQVMVLANQVAGNYQAILADTFGCPLITLQDTIDEPSAITYGTPQLHYDSVNQVCLVNVPAGGGTGALQTIWPDSSIRDTFTIVPPASPLFTATIFDQNGCEVQVPIDATACGGVLLPYVEGIDSIVHLKESSDIMAFPNPTTGSFTLQGVQPDSKVAVYDLDGKFIALLETGDQGKMELPFVPAGTYYLHIIDQEGEANYVKLRVVK